jgi:hypothetical protein
VLLGLSKPSTHPQIHLTINAASAIIGDPNQNQILALARPESECGNRKGGDV